MSESIKILEEAIQLATQADSEAVKEDENLKTFEDLVRQLQIQQRLILEGGVQKRKITNLEEIRNVDDPQELMDKLKQASVKGEENMQIHMICQRALEASQFSLALQSAESDDPAAEKTDEELVESSIEYYNLCLSNLLETQQIERLQSEMKGEQEKLKQVQLDISKLKTDPETTAGIKSKRIESLETSLAKFYGRYNFSRFLIQLLLMASEVDLNDPKISELFVKCGEALE